MLNLRELARRAVFPLLRRFPMLAMLVARTIMRMKGEAFIPPPPDALVSANTNPLTDSAQRVFSHLRQRARPRDAP